MTKKVCSSFRFRRISLLYEQQKKEFETLKKGGRDPDSLYFGGKFNNIEGSWPDKALSAYEEIWEETPEEGREYNEKVVKAFNRLGYAVEDYYSQAKLIFNEIAKKYKSKLKEMIRTHSLPADIDVANLDPITIKTPIGGLGPRGFSKTIKETSHQYMTQKVKIDYAELRDPKKISSFYKRFFKAGREPIEVFANWDALAKQLKSPDQLKSYFSGFNEKQIVRQLNEIIRLRNMHTFYERSGELHEEFNKELNNALKKLDDNYENYYRDYRGKEKKDFVAYLLGVRASEKKG